MAFVPHTPNQWSIEIESVDHTGNVSRKRYPMTAPDVITLATDIPNVISYHEGVTQMPTKGYKIIEHLVNDAFAYPDPADVAIQREVTAVITAADENQPTKIHTLRIVGADQSLVFYTTPLQLRGSVDFTQAAVQAWVNMFSTGGECYISDGERIADGSWITGKRVSKANTRG